MPALSLADGSARITRARIRLALRQPFLASALMRLPLISVRASSWCKTMGTDGFHIFYNPAWTAGLSDAQLRGVIAHELLHVVFAHVLRRNTRDPRLWNIACDYAINILLHERGFRLPEGGALDSQFVGMSSEAIYELLKADQDSTTPTILTAGLSPDDENGILEDVGADLLDPDDPRVGAARPADSPDHEQISSIIEDLREDCRAALAGNAGAWFSDECERADAALIDWRALLRNWLYDRIRCDWSLWPPNKKHIHRGLILPSVGSPAPGHLVFAVDTSGSMPIRTIASIYAEIAAFRETFPCRLTVLQADTDITSIATYDAADGAEIPETFSVVGRGGTDFRAVFDYTGNRMAEDSEPATAIVFATDGYGTFPAVPPLLPVIWLRLRNGLAAERFPFGSVVTLPTE
jgi:predicted metal-dependent peptidase